MIHGTRYGGKPIKSPLPLQPDTSVSASATRSQSPAADAKRNAAQALLAGDKDECREFLADAVAGDSQLPPAPLMFAELLLTSNRLTEASDEVEALDREFSTHPAFYRIAGQIAVAQNRFCDAELNFSEALVLLEDSEWPESRQKLCAGRCYLGLAQVAERRNEWRTVADCLRCAVAVFPNRTNLLNRIARAKFSMGDDDAAWEELENLAVLHPDMEAPSISMARIAIESDQIDLTRRWLRKATTDAPGNPVPLVLHAAWLMDRNSVSRAAVLLEQAAKINSDNTEYRIAQANLARHQGRFRVASERYRTLYSEQPNNFAIGNSLAMCLLEQHDETNRQQGFELAETNLQRFPNNKEAMATLGRAYFVTGRIHDAFRMLGTVASTGRTSSDAAYYLAAAYERAGRTANSIAILERALEARGQFFARADAQRMLKRLRTAAA